MNIVSSGAIVGETIGIVRRERRALLVWIAIHIVAGVAILFAMRPLVQAQLAAALRGGTTTLSPGPAIWAIVPVAILLALSLYNAVFRAVLRPAGRRRGAYLRLGMAEARLLGLTIILGIAFYLAMALASFATILIAAALAPLLGIGPASPGAPLLILAAMALPMAAILYFVVRFSPAAPLTLLHDRLMIGPAWRLTRRRVRPLLGAYAIVALVLALAYVALVAVTMAPTIAALATPNPTLRLWRVLLLEESEWTHGTPRLLASTIAGGLLGGLMVALHGGVIAVATRRLLEAGGSAYVVLSPVAAEEIAP